MDLCREAATGAEAIEKTTVLRPDLVLLDVTMPDMDAAQAILRINQLCPTVWVVALAMADSAGLAAGALAAGAHGLALKSEGSSDLILTVRNVGNDQPFLSPAAVTMIRSQLAKGRTSRPIPSDLTRQGLEILEPLAQGRSS